MKPAESVSVTVPRELLPDVLELVTEAYAKMQATLAKDEKVISDLQFRISELQNTIRAMREVNRSDDF